MDKNNGFSYTYSAAANKEVWAIRQKYIPREESKFEELKRLDREVQNSGMIEALTIGLLGLLIFGLGMCMSLKVVGESMILGIILGLVGTFVMLSAYPVYHSINTKTKNKLVPRILEITSELTQGN